MRNIVLFAERDAAAAAASAAARTLRRRKGGSAAAAFQVRNVRTYLLVRETSVSPVSPLRRGIRGPHPSARSASPTLRFAIQAAPTTGFCRCWPVRPVRSPTERARCTQTRVSSRMSVSSFLGESARMHARP